MLAIYINILQYSFVSKNTAKKRHEAATAIDNNRSQAARYHFDCKACEMCCGPQFDKKTGDYYCEDGYLVSSSELDKIIANPPKILSIILNPDTAKKRRKP